MADINNLTDAMTALYSNADSQANLARLPTELQVAIVDLLPATDMKVLRLVSRRLEKAAESTFLKTYFITRKHAITEHSLETLVAITTSLKLRSCLKSIQFFPTRLQKPRQIPVALGGQTETTTPNHNNNNNNLKEAWAWWVQSAWWLDTGGATELMATVLRNLKAASQISDLALTRNRDPPAFGLATLGRRLEIGPDPVLEKRDPAKGNGQWERRVFEHLLGAIGSSGFPAAAFKGFSGEDDDDQSDIEDE